MKLKKSGSTKNARIWIYVDKKEFTPPEKILSRLQLEVSGGRYSFHAREETKELLDKLALAYSERRNNLIKRHEHLSSTDNHYVKENIGHFGLLHPMSSFMNIVCIGHPLLQYEAIVGKEFLNK
ncbi:hypothetical protein ElyMa_006778600 [Elysia marginata]|uniref:Uncharacterized protein n=1 Tax=Elysia marginata TaxID=1093978 RepID=A0AAV4J1E5_9GAST|nr:hypothetical protein ElyMa_006778600 [Elysia marginata]